MHRICKPETSGSRIASQKIGNQIEKHFQSTSLTFALQDGPDAGQTVPHVHIHIMPRKKGDFKNNDDIYREIEKEDRRARQVEEMKAEADQLRRLFEPSDQFIPPHSVDYQL